MTHCDLDGLALVALEGAPLPPDELEHLQHCPLCETQLAGFRNVVAIGRDSGDVALVTPPDAVWAAIADAVVTDSSAPGRAAGVTPLRSVRTEPSRWSRWVPVGVAAAAGAVFGGLVINATSGGSPEPESTAPRVVAEAQLASLPDGVDTVGRGTAKFEQNPDGSDILVVDTENLQQADGYYQVWLINPQTSGLVSLGTVGSGAQQVTFPVPAGIDPKEFSVVDISDEPLDGDPNHSKVSILRGELDV